MEKNTSVKCPSCQEVFKVDDSVFTDIVKQVRDQQFKEEVNTVWLLPKEKRPQLLNLPSPK